MTVDSSTLSGNTASFVGGGIYNAGTLTVVMSTFDGNSPEAIFGIYNDGGCNTFE
jgi:hypothetical protein